MCLTAIDPAIAYRPGWPPPVSGPRPGESSAAVQVPGPGMLAPGSSVARYDGLFGCHGLAPGRPSVVRHLVRAIVSLWPEVVEFKGWGQLVDGLRNETAMI